MAKEEMYSAPVDDVLKELTEFDQQNCDLLRTEIARLPIGYQKIYVRPGKPKSILGAHLIRNDTFGFRSSANGSVKPISKIVNLTHEPEGL